MKLFSKTFFMIITLFLWTAGALAEPVWIDVRTEAEYTNNHIEGDANIPLATIDAEALAGLFGKDAEINLYCGSGGRAGRAKEILDAAGFTNVCNVGGIDDVRELREIAMSSASQ